MIAGVNVAIVLNNHRAPTGWLMMANRTRRTDKIGKRPFDIHHENLADVAFDPVVKKSPPEIHQIHRGAQTIPLAHPEYHQAHAISVLRGQPFHQPGARPPE